jgi:hypothetical protein
MAFGPEIRFKIGGDTSALSRAFTGLQSVAAAAGARIQKSFGLKDAMKGVFQGIGIGSVQQVADMIQAPFRRAMESARDQAALNEDLMEGTFRTIAAIGGPARELEIKKRQFSDLSGDIAKMRVEIAKLNANPLNLFSDSAQQLIREQEQAVNALIKKQADIGAEIHIGVEMENRRTAAIQRQMQLDGQLADNQLRHRAELMQFDQRLAHLQREYNILQKQGARPAALQQNIADQAAIKNQKAIAAQAMKERFEDVRRVADAAEAQARIEINRGGEIAKSQARLNALRAEYDVLIKRNATSAEIEANRSSNSSAATHWRRGARRSWTSAKWALAARAVRPAAAVKPSASPIAVESLPSRRKKRP